ncbi:MULTISPECIES: PPOX class F420-dependent oxidoreductase [unclassified Streptomyces]|uniref:PPOX class F420-dependent oxidoreductase n=1 Tax=Streptomyces evansiae TaxID=3075535 RepID=A0ABD5E9V3_9ACTN|nr:MULTISPECIES: PPOX class F420-dependent oxidoreductase [unclassified Streptomyces]EFL04041.1 pyridoxamine 5'-phosphate oxidase [Streptomyces sp. SPB78]MDT0412862.1 PPOX class F420-dependent oxidoreductase [Streptomyces sp. DSM 41979]MDT0417577.1 PPOX class F420-dependent oxidoreductase [Streptomyces sp. DSM 41982]MDT0423997.1 PPOX class F420-dependent oxidoreductase [Streptomyces sp. DSM 41859]NJA57161.1 PPOX class F420-dependent oxidoreductase [Streptomyces sp. NEAU-H3]
MTHKMTDEEWRAFVSDGTRTAKLATVRADGSPHIAPIWFVLDGSDLVLNTGKGTVKGRNLARDGRVALCVDDERPPFSFVTIEGSAEISEDPEELLRWATKIAERYVGPEEAEVYGRRNGVPGELVVRVRVEKVVAYGGVAD